MEFNSFKLILEENYTFIWPELLANKVSNNIHAYEVKLQL